MNRSKPKVGQVMYYEQDGIVKSKKVIRVGTKYFYMNIGYGERQFYIDDWTDTCGYKRIVLYATIKEIEEKKESMVISRLIGDCFEYGHNYKRLPFSALKKIKDIIEEDSQ